MFVTDGLDAGVTAVEEPEGSSDLPDIGTLFPGCDGHVFLPGNHAGGQRAMLIPVEGAEDNRDLGKEDLEKLNFSQKDTRMALGSASASFSGASIAICLTGGCLSGGTATNAS